MAKVRRGLHHRIRPPVRRSTRPNSAPPPRPRRQERRDVERDDALRALWLAAFQERRPPDVWQLSVINPIAVMASDAPDPVFLAALIKVAERFGRGPRPICGACEHEFAPGEVPALISILKPAFASEGERVRLVVSAICPECASLPAPELEVAVAEKLRSVNPSLQRVPSGRA